jgi:hypothetical protein
MEAVNGLLAKLASDSDFQDDLRQPQVRVVSQSFLDSISYGSSSAAHWCAGEAVWV